MCAQQCCSNYLYARNLDLYGAATITLYARNGAATITCMRAISFYMVLQQLHGMRAIVLQHLHCMRTISILYSAATIPVYAHYLGYIGLHG